MMNSNRSAHVEAAIKFAPTGVAADAIREGVIGEIRTSSCRGDDLLDLFRRGAEEAALLATVWHEPAESFCLLLQVGGDRGMPSAQARGILIGAFGCDPTDYQTLESSNLNATAEGVFRAEAQRLMAASNPDERLATFQRVALDCGVLVREQEIPRPDAADTLMELAQSSGLAAILRMDDLQHVI